MTKNDFKIKYILGTYKDEPTYPNKEDLFAIADMWYHLDGGRSWIHEYRGLPDQGETIFTVDKILDRGLPKRKTTLLISTLLDNGDIGTVKETKHTKYHIINKR